MPRKTKNTNLDPEDFYSLDTQEESQEFLDSYTNLGLDSYRSAYGDYDYDSDNYGYLD